jgi:hypothetical protein
MSWWDIGDDVIGDAPADIMTHALSEYVCVREKQSQAKPTLQEMLDSFAAALRKIEGGKRYEFRKLVARQESAPTTATAGKSTNHELVSVLGQAFEKIDAEYQQRFGREPRLSELLQTLSFILGYEPERFLSNAEGMKIREIVAE